MPRPSSEPESWSAHAQLLAAYPPAIVELALQARDAVLQAMPEASERTYLGWRGIGFHHPNAGYICGIFLHPDRIKVGYEQGHLLHDPDGRLDPGGRKVRYLTIRHWDESVALVVAEFLDQAASFGSRPPEA